MTKLQEEIKKKKELNEDEEYLRQVDLPTGAKYVGDKLDEERSNEQKVKDNVNTDLQSKQTRPFSYRQSLSEYGLRLLKEADFGKGWLYYCFPTDGGNIRFMGKTMKTEQGILLIVQSPNGNVYSRGIRTTSDAQVDSKAIEILVVQAENTVDAEKGLLIEKDGTRRTKSGIYV